MNDPRSIACPVEIDPGERIQLAHGEGGRLMRQLIRHRIVDRLSIDPFDLADAAVVANGSGKLAITTDSFVVSPLFFPGGDIGSLAVYGTVNDLAMAGADPRYMTLSLILEEGFPLRDLDRILASVCKAAARCKVRIVAGDTKVVPRGAADGVFVNTTGVGVCCIDSRVHADRIEVGDHLLVSGPIGKHGLAVFAARESLGLEPAPVSDCAPLHTPAKALLQRLGDDLHAMRDATRGGVAAVLHEWAEACEQTLWIDESKIPVAPESHSVAELLGFDPLFIANEGTFVAAVHPDAAAAAIECLQQFPVTMSCRLIGRVQCREVSPVLVHRGIGVDQPLDERTGVMLPRIC